MKSLRVSRNLSSLITIFSTLIISLSSNLQAQQLSQLTNGAIRGAGSLDPTFKNLGHYPQGVSSTGTPLNAKFVGNNPQIRAATVQTDGKILIGGNFQIQQQGVRYRNFVGITVIWKNLARLNPDGTVDTTFMSESVANLIENGNFDDSPTSKPLIWGPDGTVHTISAELNEDSYQYVIAGDFLNFSHNNLGFSAPRLRYVVLDALPDDPATEEGRFPEPRIRLASERAQGLGFDSTVRKIKRVSGGGAVPQTTTATAATRLALSLVSAPIGSTVLQLNTSELYRRIGGVDGVEGTEADWLLLNAAFVAPTYYAMGDFVSAFDNETQPFIVKMSRDGTELATDATWTSIPSPNARVNDIAVSGVENIIVGEFTEVGGVPFNRIAKIDDAGVVDVAFNAGTGFNANAYGVALNPLLLNVVVVGEFTSYNGTPVGRICRLDLSGNLDGAYPAANYGNNSGANGVIRTLSRQPDGRILIAGSFTSYNGIPRSGIARLEVDGSLDESFTPKGNASGVLAFSTDINGGPGTANLFARPIVVGDFTSLYGNGFKGVGRLLGGSFPGIWHQPAEINGPHIAVAGSTITLNVAATDNRIGFTGVVPAMPFVAPQASSEPLMYQWQLNGVPIPGANQSSLELTNLKYNQAGQYRVLIYNSQYYIYSQPTQVTVLNPYVGVIPAAGIRVQGRIEANAGLNSGLGGNISMTVSRLGTATGTFTMLSGGRSVIYRFAGQFDGSGTLEVTIPRTNLAPLTLTLVMDFSGAPTDFEFTDGASQISDGINTAVITAWNSRWSTTNLASSFSGKYNVGLETDPLDIADTIITGPITRAKVSQGHGYLSMTVTSSTGVALITGALSDGTVFTTSSTLWGDSPATLPVWIPLYLSKGALQGELTIDSLVPGNPVTADLGWTKPSGVVRSPDAFGFQDVRLTAFVGSGRYSSSAFTASLPPGPGNFNLTFDDGLWTTPNGGLSAPPFTQSFTVGASSTTAVLPNPKKVTISLNRTTGLVTGSFTDADSLGAVRTVRYQSMILTQGGAPLLRGYFVMPNTARYSSFYLGGSVEGF